MRFFQVFAVSAIIFFLAAGCDSLQKFLHDDEAVARVGDHRLYRAEVESVIPSGLSTEDSLAMARKYIETWASGKVYMDMALQQLSKSEKDLTKEMEDYREAILKYRYEQHYVNSRLDTLVSDNEVQAYYDAHASDFVLNRPVIKARYVNLSADSPNFDIIRKKFASEKPEEADLVDSLVRVSSIKWLDFSQNWVDVTVLSKEFGVEWETLIGSLKKGIAESEDAYGNVCLAFIPEVIEAGKGAPVEYCASQIRDIILSARKHNLILSLERDLLVDASVKGYYEIFENGKDIQ